MIRDLREHTSRDGKSLSSLIAEFIEHAMKEKEKREARENILRTIGKARIHKNALRILDKLRSEDDRT